MPKGTMSKTFESGDMVFWFECDCGHRWEGSSQRARSMAHRLHSRVCNTSQLSQLEMRPIAPHKQSKTSAIDACLDNMKTVVAQKP